MTHSSITVGHPRRERTTAVGRILDTIVDPLAAFETIRERPTWGIAFLTLVAARFGSLLAFYHPDTTPAKLASGVLFQLVTLFPLVAVTSTLVWMVSLVWRSRVTYAAAWCVTTHVTLAHSLLTVAIASVAGALLPESIDVELRHPPFTSLGSLVEMNEQPLLHALAAEVDVRSIYAMLLTWVGVRAASHASRPVAAAVVLTCFAVIAALSIVSAT